MVEIKKITVANRLYYYCTSEHSVYEVDPATARQLDQASCSQDQVRIINLLNLKNSANHNYNREKSLNQATSLHMILTQQCNMHCYYCWENEKQTRQAIQLKTAYAAVDWLFEKSCHNGTKRVEICFFGGEPLLEWETLKAVLDYAIIRNEKYQKIISFKLSTNGTLLTPRKIAHLSRYNINYAISCDGIAAVHDSYRTYLNHKSTHQDVVQAIKNLLAANIPVQRVTAMVTVNKNTLPYLETNIDFIRQLGIKIIYVNPVRSVELPEQQAFLFTGQDYSRLASILSQKRLELKASIHTDNTRLLDRYLKGINFKEKLFVRCQAGRYAFSVNPAGELYGCSLFAFDHLCAIGHVNSGLDREKQTRFLCQCKTVDEKDLCRSCWARYFCGGHCYYDEMKNQPLTSQEEDCQVTREMIECNLKTLIQWTHSFPKEEAR